MDHERERKKDVEKSAFQLRYIFFSVLLYEFMLFFLTFPEINFQRISYNATRKHFKLIHFLWVKGNENYGSC